MKALKSMLSQDYFKSNNIASIVSSAILDLYKAKSTNSMQYFVERLRCYEKQDMLKKEVRHYADYKQQGKCKEAGRGRGKSSRT